jgi:K+-sensing histidine kinase KdpD
MVIQSGEPRLFAEVFDPEKQRIAQDAEHASAMRAADVRSMIVVPLHARGKTLGALTFVVGPSGRRYSSHDLAIAVEFSRRVATGIDNASLYEQAQRATRAREELLAIVSHDLKNPLNVILMSAGMMTPANGAEDRRSSRGQIETIRRSAKRMNRLIQELLDTASIEAGKLVVERRRLAVSPIIHDAIEAMQPLAARQSLSLTSELPADIPSVFVDAGVGNRPRKYLHRHAAVSAEALRDPQATLT